ncbi:MAG: SAM-dependent methyltransferase [Verrucomicrobiaceae bacterium]|nr:SAM-dependent methyltransferase [Verrucomicrobiaceae bacterium]
MLTGDQALTDFIRETIRRQGPVTFAWFMEQALYHPESGYYSSGQCQIGRHGDYFTNVSVGPLFGKLLAGQFAEMWEMLGRPADFAVVEQGAHGGEFARDVLMAARQRTPEFFSAMHYCIIEPFPILRRRQAETLGDFDGKVTWAKSLDSLEPFGGVHFSNELLDAMPVHLISREADSDEWRERWVGDSDGGFAFVHKPIGDETLRRHLAEIPLPPAPYETEVNLAALGWIEDVARKLTRGFVLTVDFGYSRDRFYARERTTGTLQCYAEHRTVASPLQNIGHADISAHVDWTSVVERAEKCGLTLTGFTDQHHFITGLLSRLAPEETERRALQTLLHPELLGTRFQFLALGKDAPATQLSGFSFARDPHVALGL